MNRMDILLRQLSDLLDPVRQPWALVGGLAVSIRTEPRFTRDLDLAVAVTDDGVAEALVFRLQTAGFRTLATVEQEQTRRLATARLAPAGDPPEGFLVDILFASSGIEPEVCAEAERLLVFPGCVVPVAQLHHLIALKILARDDRTRPQDAADLRQMIAAAQGRHLDLARHAVGLIETRQFNRGRDLVTALANACREFGTANTFE